MLCTAVNGLHFTATGFKNSFGHWVHIEMCYLQPNTSEHTPP